MSGDNLPKLSNHLILSNSNQNQRQQQQQSQTQQQNLTTSITNNQRYVKLNVGGRLFSTSLDTLTKQDNMLRAMFSGRMDVITDLDGYILIDRCGKHFEFILNYLRDEDTQFVNMNLDDFKTELELYEILKEAKFYCIQPLVNLIEQKILLLKSLCSPEPYFGSSIVSMVTSKSDLVKILNSTDKPCIRLLINRHNNKYSYTNNSDDNLLKNIELFERMAIKFKNRILFIKDTTSNEEICCWYFHGNGKKMAEVCCTSIVYTTEKKQTKVEFPDSKILEEIFVNAVLFESKENNNTENNGMYATGTVIVDEDSNQFEEPMPRISLTNNSNLITNSTSANNLILNPSASSSTSNSTSSSSTASNSSTSSNSNTQTANIALVQNSSANSLISSSSSSLVNSSNIITSSNRRTASGKQ